MNKDFVVNALTNVTMIVLVGTVLGVIIGLIWRFILKPLFFGGC
jgi:hypothetical protein